MEYPGKVQAVSGKVIDDNLEIDWTPVVQEFGLDLLIRQIGLANVIEEVGLARVVEEVGGDKLLDSLTPEQLARLKPRL